MNRPSSVSSPNLLLLLITLAFFTLVAFPRTESTRIPTNVVELNDRFLDVMGQGFWFVEFYAPWCAHCKKLMPVWELVGHALADKQSPVRVGKVDCTRFSTIASALGIRGFPTIIFFRNGVQIPYDGERTKEDIVKFAEKCSGPVVDKLQSKTQFEELRKHADREPFFVFFDPSGRAQVEGSPESALRRRYENVSDSLFTEVHFYEAREQRVLGDDVFKGESGNQSRVLAFKDDGHWTEFGVDGLEDGEVSLLDWVRRERWPLLPQLTASNLHTIAESTGKKLVLIPLEAIDRLNASTPSGSFFHTIRQAAQLIREDEDMASHFQFGWLEGDQLTNGIVMGTLATPNLVVFNLSSYEFYLSDDRPEQMTAQSVVLFLQNVQLGHVQVQGGRAWITRLRRMVYDVTTNINDMFQHQPILTVCLFGVPLAFFAIITYSICSADFSVDRDEVFPEDEEEDGGDEDEEDEAGADFDVVQPEAIEAADHEKAD